jgi:hypothetical protein
MLVSKFVIFKQIHEGSDSNIGNQPDSTMLIDDNGSNINPGLVNLPTYRKFWFFIHTVFIFLSD